MIQLIDDFHPYFEARLILSRLAQGQSVQDNLKKARLKAADQAPLMEACFADALALETTVFQGISLTEDQRFLFTPFEGTAICPVDMMINLPFDFDSLMPIEDLLEAFPMTLERGLHDFISMAEPQEPGLPSLDDPRALFARLGQLGVSAASQAAILRIWTQTESLMSTALDALVTAAHALIPRLEGLKPHAEAFCHTTGEALHQLLHSWGLTFSADNGIRCYPLAGEPNAVYYYQNDRGDAVMFVGYHFHKLAAVLSKEEPEPQHLQEALRHMGDKTKFEILRRLAQGPVHGAQLAQELSLTSATISHHLSQLTGLELITMDASGSKLMCSLNKVKLKAVLDAFSEMLKLA